MSQQSLETRWAPVQAALERASKKQRANPIGEKLDKIEEMLRAWLAADSDDVGDEARAASLAALHARIEAEGLLDAIKAHEKETNAALSKLNKAAEKAFPPIDHAVPVELPGRLMKQAIYNHLLVEGRFATAEILHREAGLGEPSPGGGASASAAASAGSGQAAIASEVSSMAAAAAAAEQATAEEDAAAAMEVDPPSSSAASASSAPVPGAIGEVTREALKEMHRALDALSAGDLTLALAWVAEHGDAPVQSGRRPRAAEGTLAYELERLPLSATLHTLRFAQLLSGDGVAGGAPAALAYARLHLSLPSWRPLQRKLLGALAYARRLDSSPYASLLSAELREGAAARFRGECMQTLGLPRTSALQTVFDVGRHVLPKLLKCAAVLPAKYAASWKAGGMLPVDVDLPNWAVFHSIFVCPISKEVATPSNPPMMLPCGHALCLSSVAKLARGSRSVRFKCPYCPAEASLAMALELKF